MGQNCNPLPFAAIITARQAEESPDLIARVVFLHGVVSWSVFTPSFSVVLQGDRCKESTKGGAIMCVCMRVCAVSSNFTEDMYTHTIQLFHHGAPQACPHPVPILHQLLPIAGFPFVSPLNLFAQNKGHPNKTAAVHHSFSRPCLFQFLSLPSLSSSLG